MVKIIVVSTLVIRLRCDAVWHSATGGYPVPRQVARLSVHDAVVVTSNQTPTRGATFTPDAAKLVSS